MNNNKRITFFQKILYYPLLIFLILIVLIAGLNYRIRGRAILLTERMPLSLGGLGEKFNGEVYPASHIARQIEKCLYVQIPMQASNLYCANSGFFYGSCHVALTLPSEQLCTEFLKKQLGVSMDEFKQSSRLPAGFTKRAPDTWPDELKGNWDLGEYKEFYICEDTGYGNRAVVYIPGHHRIFIYDY